MVYSQSLWQEKERHCSRQLSLRCHCRPNNNNESTLWNFRPSGNTRKRNWNRAKSVALSHVSNKMFTRTVRTKNDANFFWAARLKAYGLAMWVTLSLLLSPSKTHTHSHPKNTGVWMALTSALVSNGIGNFYLHLCGAVSKWLTSSKVDTSFWPFCWDKIPKMFVTWVRMPQEMKNVALCEPHTRCCDW